MSLIRHDAPRTLVSFVWAVAGMLAIFFAVVVSSLFILKHYYPVDAQSVTMKAISGNCVSGETRVGVNNYPGQTAIKTGYPTTDSTVTNGYQHGPVENALGGDYQCSNICVPGMDQNKPVSDPANISVITNFLSGATVGDQPMVPILSGDQFVSKVKAYYAETDTTKKQADKDELKRMMILPYSRTTICAGNPGGQGQSVDYAQIKVKDKAVTIEEPNKTKDSADLAAAQAKVAAAAAVANQAAPVPIAGPPEKNIVFAPVASNNGTSNDLATCKSKVNKFLNDYSEAGFGVQKLIDKFNNIKTGYADLKSNSKYQDESQALTRCKQLSKQVDEIVVGTGETKTKLAKCEKDVNDYIYTTAKGLNGQTDPNLDSVINEYKTLKKSIFASRENVLANCENLLSRINSWGNPVLAEKPRFTTDQVEERTQEVNAYWSGFSRQGVFTVTGGIGEKGYVIFHGNTYATWVCTRVSVYDPCSEPFWSMSAKGQLYKFDTVKDMWIPWNRNSFTIIHAGTLSQPSYSPMPFTSNYIGN